ncbi:mast cell protease 1A-like [Indicator indicator]|uniref:mast cell protease 1A-like n=1 Tax=Indicator indicator TaxID=1002788 RepID=UPI0023DF7300|nr:mast cell protease 1A-like [Indicator indicator]
MLLLLISAFVLLPWAGAGRITGGWEVKPHSRPYMAYVSITSDLDGCNPETFPCGGFLIHPHAVLSAAHCVAGKRKVTIRVTLGAHNIKKEEPSWQVFHIDHWVIHPNYSDTNYKNDIMLLKLKPKANLTKEVKTISLASQNDYVKPGRTCQVAGWGKTSLNEGLSSVLREVDLKVQREEECVETFKMKYIQQSMVCAGDKDGKKSTFRGDSGGPLVCKGKAHGIVSYGRRNHFFPKVFTRVSYFEPWICKELRKFLLQDLPECSSSD